MLTSSQLAVGVGSVASLVRKLLAQLAKDGLVTGVAGRSGGVRLARPASEITLAEIYRSVCGQLARIFLTVASSVPTWTTFLQSLPQIRRRPCSSHCLRRRSPPVFRRCALWTERHLRLSVGPLPEQTPFHPTPIHDSFESRPARGQMLSLCGRESVVHPNE